MWFAWLSLYSALLYVLVAGQNAVTPCVLPLYMPGETEVTFEANFLVDVLLSQIPKRCGCHVEFKDRNDFVADMPACSILPAVGGVTAEEETALQHLQGTVLLHLSDESLSASTSAYNNTAAVFRQYLTSKEAIAYLTGSAGTHQHVHWIPLGYGKFKVIPAMYLAFSERPQLWTWIGSSNHKPEREQMLKHLRSASLLHPEISQSGILHTYGDFAGEGSMGMQRYSYHMYATKLVPLPSGGSPEQYRVWEAIEAGCIPILLLEHTKDGGQLWPIKALRFKYLTVETWADLPDLLLTLQSTDRDLDFQNWQSHNTRTWSRMKQRLGDQIAQEVCAAAKLIH